MHQSCAKGIFVLGRLAAFPYNVKDHPIRTNIHITFFVVQKSASQSLGELKSKVVLDAGSHVDIEKSILKNRTLT